MHRRHYYPEFEDINAYENTDNRLNEYGDEELNRAHIENMAQRYRRLSEGSLDSNNIAKYRAKLSEWKARKSENDSLFEKKDREITLQNINGDKKCFASSDVCDIAAHEYGHVFSKGKEMNAIEISKEAYYNIYRQYPSTKKILDYYKEISAYSFEVGKNELISEILAKHNSDPTAFTEEIIKLLKKKATPRQNSSHIG